MTFIELESKPSFSRILRTGKKNFILNFTWNDLYGFWYFNITDMSKKQVASGLRLITGFDLLSGMNNSSTPAGELELFSQLNNSFENPRFENIGDYSLKFTPF